MSLWSGIKEEASGNIRFFLISFLYIDLESYYRINFALAHDHHFSLDVVNDLLPWERDVYLILLKEWIKEEKERMEKERRKSSGGPRPSSSRPPRR